MMLPPIYQRLAGVFLVGIGVYFTIETWHTARNEGHYLRVAIAFPAFAIAGLGMICFPMHPEEMRARWGTEKPTFSQLPFVWKVITVVAVAATVGFMILLEIH